MANPMHTPIPNLRLTPGAVVDHPAVFVQRIVSLRSLVHQGRRLKAFRGVVGLAPWVAEEELCVLGEGVQVVVGRHGPVPRY